MTMDEVLRMDIDKALILIRGKNVLEVDKYDYSKHPEAKKLRPSKAASHVPAWRANQPQEKQAPSAPPSQAAEKKPAQKKKPAPAAVIMQYTGLSQVTGMEPPSYACVGTSDGIASYRSMENYISQMQQNGLNTKIEVFKGLSHGFGLGERTVAEGWIDRAISFWEDNMNALDKR